MSTSLSRPNNQVLRPAGCLRSCLLNLVRLFLLVALLVVLAFGFDVFVGAPWAYPLSGRPTLTGTWVSQFTVPSGTRFAMQLNLRRAKFLAYGSLQAPEGANPLLEGAGNWCDDHGRHAEDIPLDGQVPLFSSNAGSAGQVEINLQSARHPQPGLQPAYFSGAWNADRLTLRPIYIYWDPQTHGLLASSNNPDFASPPAVVLKKADAAAFSAACATLGNVPA